MVQRNVTTWLQCDPVIEEVLKYTFPKTVADIVLKSAAQKLKTPDWLTGTSKKAPNAPLNY